MQQPNHNRVALYTRVITHDQHTENQSLELRRYCEARGRTVLEEFTDEAVSGSKTNRPALDAMMKAAQRAGRLMPWWSGASIGSAAI